MERGRHYLWTILVGLLLTDQLSAADSSAWPPPALNAVKAAGGVAVHVGCGDGRLLAELGKIEHVVALGLDRDAAAIDQARNRLRSQGVYGRVSCVVWSGERLPFVDNLVNLIVVSKGGAPVPDEEILRVLAPRGTAYVAGREIVKPVPDDIDDWTHFLHGPDNNPVGNDRQVGPPKHLQWTAGPLWTRSHEIHPSIMGMVSAAGRMFYVHDAGPVGVFHKSFPGRWELVARDAFNGTVLWKRPLGDWADSLAGWLGLPVDGNRRLVAAADRLYISLGDGRPVTAFNAADGKVVRTYEGTGGPCELVLHGGILLVTHAKSGLLAFEAATGKYLWRIETEIVPLTLAACGDGVLFGDGSAIVCLDPATGKERWRYASTERRRRLGADILVAGEDRVLVAGGKDGTMRALDSKTGTLLWTWPDAGTSRKRGHSSPVAFRTPFPVFIADGLVWPGISGVGLDPATGAVKRKLSVAKTTGHHHRCYMQKATARFLLASYRGVEFIPLGASDRPSAHDWTRGTCKLGVVPCNGLLYCPPHSCFCYPGTKLQGLNALAARRREAPAATAPNLEQGPAFTDTGSEKARTAPDAPEWATYRQGPARAGGISQTVSPPVKQVWRWDVNGKITPPVVATGRVFVSRVDAHEVCAFDAATGAPVWQRLVGGRVDSPPTLHRGRVYLGCRDGWVYCLRASDGALCWRFRAAPREERIGAFGQLESVWPVHGSVLIQNDVLYCTAGRSSFLDGGIYVYGLNPRDGSVVHEARLYDTEQVSGAFSMSGALPDILVGDGRHVYMGRIRFDAQLKVLPNQPHSNDHARKKGVAEVGAHLMTTAGFLDDTGFNRSFWTYSKHWPGYFFGHLGPKSGDLLVFDATTTYGVKIYDKQIKALHRSPNVIPGTGSFLYADDNRTEPDFEDPGPEQSAKDRWSFTRSAPPKWSIRVPIRVRAMVLAEATLFIAGPVDTLDEKDPLASHEGRGESKIIAVSTTDGASLAEFPLKSEPVFDGLVAAGGKLFVSCRDGSVVCLE